MLLGRFRENGGLADVLRAVAEVSALALDGVGGPAHDDADGLGGERVLVDIVPNAVVLFLGVLGVAAERQAEVGLAALFGEIAHLDTLTANVVTNQVRGETELLANLGEVHALEEQLNGKVGLLFGHDGLLATLLGDFGHGFGLWLFDDRLHVLLGPLVLGQAKDLVDELLQAVLGATDAELVLERHDKVFSLHLGVFLDDEPFLLFRVAMVLDRLGLGHGNRLRIDVHVLVEDFAGGRYFLGHILFARCTFFLGGLLCDSLDGSGVLFLLSLEPIKRIDDVVELAVMLNHLCVGVANTVGELFDSGSGIRSVPVIIGFDRVGMDQHQAFDFLK